MRRIAIAQNTIEILESGNYTSPSGKLVDIQQDLQSCLAGTKYYEPDALEQIQQEVISGKPQYEITEFEVENETTLEGAKRIIETGKFTKIGVLNFASARNPGGGFLKGSQAQEESLARSSALYKSILLGRKYYEFHRGYESLFYSDRMIYSPNCPVLKDDAGNFLENFYCVDFITSAAPNAGGIAKHQPQDLDKIPEALYSRGTKVLSLAAAHNCDALILGAWGCGVFRNKPSMVAQMFADLLLPGGEFHGRFKSVVFSIFSSKSEGANLMEFQKRFIGS
ncbi:TIGR02452 family protein [Calothrix sp. 336/3]|uniref:TIGR02452 family protein n=1 Tax=Calothrix sp. 336/3 TaxID=1337936 RepID=UPI0004E3F91B|nr:TIGR02452 family protein [Calothrix sp. 336/3]AKG21630.1 hypothetical protein IJ00_10440 [Calothrix sp. 336/3]